MNFNFGSPTTTAGSAFGTATPSTGFGFGGGDTKSTFGAATTEIKPAFNFTSPTSTTAAPAFGGGSFSFGPKTTAAAPSLFSTPTPANNAPVFGGGKPLSFTGFASPPNQTVGSPGFGQPSQPQQNAAPTVGFGGAQPKPPAFGTPATQASSAASAFGSSSFSFAQPPAGAGAGAAPAPAFGGFSTPASGFSTVPAAPTSATVTSQPSFGGSTFGQSAFGKPVAGFGTPAASTAPAPSFGATTPATGFAQPQPATSAATPQSGIAFGQSFGQPQPQAQGQTQPPAFGSTGTGGLNFGATTAAQTGLNFGTTTTASSGLGFTPASTAGISFGDTKPALGQSLTLTPATTGLGFGPTVASSGPISTGLNFGTAVSSAAPTSTLSTGFALPTSLPTGLSTSQAPGISLPSAATTAASTGRIKMEGVCEYFGDNLRFNALSFATPSSAATSLAPSGLGFGVSTSGGIKFTATTSTAASTAAPVSGIAGLGTTSTALSLTTATTVTPANPPQAVSSINFAQLEENINKWTLELEEQEKTFINQATQINAWDRLLIANGEKIVELNDAVTNVKNEQQSLEHELDFVLAQQNELEDILAPLEKELGDNNDRVRDPEREHMYSLAENLDTQLRQMSEDLKEVIEHLNETNRSQDTNDPIVQIGRILNAHMSSMQWIDNSIAQISTKLDQLKATHDTLRRDNERSFQLTYN